MKVNNKITCIKCGKPVEKYAVSDLDGALFRHVDSQHRTCAIEMKSCDVHFHNCHCDECVSGEGCEYAHLLYKMRKLESSDDLDGRKQAYKVMTQLQELV